MDTREPRLAALRDALVVDYSPSGAPHFLVIDAILDGELPAPSAGAVAYGFAHAVNLGLFAGSMFDPSLSTAMVQEGAFEQLGPGIRYVLAVQAICPWAIRVLADDLSWALGSRGIKVLHLTGMSPHNEHSIGTSVLLDALWTLHHYPGAYEPGAMPIDVTRVGSGCGIRLKFHGTLSDDLLAQLEDGLFTWRAAIQHFQSEQGDPPSSPDVLLGRVGRSWSELSVHFKEFPHAADRPLDMLRNMLGRWIRQGVPLASASVRV